jgi:hypothetical protein
VIRSSPDLTTGAWNEELLWKYLYLEKTKEVVRFDRTTPTENYYLEFGLLDNPYWLEIDNTAINNISPRSIWIRFYDKKVIVVKLYCEGYGSDGFQTELELRFDSRLGSIVLNRDDNKTLRYFPITKIVYVSLTLLGDSMDGVRIKPVGKRLGNTIYVAAVDKQVDLTKSDMIPGFENYFRNAFIKSSLLAYQSADLIPDEFPGISFPIGTDLNKVKLPVFIGRFMLESNISFMFTHYDIELSDGSPEDKRRRSRKRRLGHI